MNQNNIELDLDYDDNLEADAVKFSIDGKEREIETDEGYLIRETGLYLTPEACVRMSLDMFLGFPSDAITAYYIWAQDFVAGQRNYAETRKLWLMLKKEHTRYWNPRYYLAKTKGVRESKVRNLFIRMKVVHACRTACRIALNYIDDRDWCCFVPRFLEYREIGLEDRGETDLGQGSGKSGSARHLTEGEDYG